MKRILTVLFTAIFAFVTVGGCTTALADTNPIKIDALRIDPLTSSLTVSGSVESGRGSIPMVLWVKTGDTTVSAQQIVSGKSADGEAKFEFDPIPFDSNTKSGLYTITVSASFVNAAASASYNYIGVEKRYDAVESIVDSKTDKSKMLETIEDYYDVFEIDKTVFNDLSGDAKDVLAKLMMKDTYTCPPNYTDEGSADVISSNISRFVANYNSNMIIAQAVDISSEADLTAWLTDYAKAAGFYDDDTSTTDYDESKIAKDYFDDLDKTSTYIGRISAAAKTAENFANLKDQILKASLLTFIETSNYSKTVTITEAFPKLFDIFTTDFNSLSSYNKVLVYQAVTGTYWETPDKFCDAVALETSKYVSGGSSGSGSSKRGSSGGSYSSKPVEVSKDIVSTTTGASFGDMAGYEWAQTAVTELSKKGIVSGRAKDSYVPAGNVTRAEFVKMLTLALGIEPIAEYKGIFVDAHADDWFVPYVEAASEANIAMGSDGSFRPNENITRQDMAVMLFRACGYAASEAEKDVFTDSAAISDYAKSAVYSLYEKGILLGSGNGEFTPTANATRAEAAQIVFRMLESK